MKWSYHLLWACHCFCSKVYPDHDGVVQQRCHLLEILSLYETSWSSFYINAGIKLGKQRIAQWKKQANETVRREYLKYKQINEVFNWFTAIYIFSVTDRFKQLTSTHSTHDDHGSLNDIKTNPWILTYRWCFKSCLTVGCEKRNLNYKLIFPDRWWLQSSSHGETIFPAPIENSGGKDWSESRATLK